MILQQKNAEDFGIATYLSELSEFINHAFSAVDLNWENYVTSIPQLYRPSEIRSIYGSPEKVNTKLNWQAEKTMPVLQSLCLCII